MKMDVSDERDFRNTLANFFQRERRIVVGHREPHNLATGADHLFDLFYGLVDVGSISLGHRLNGDGRATTNLNMFDLNCSGFSHRLLGRRRVRGWTVTSA